MGATHIASYGDLEEKVFKILERVGCPVEGNNIAKKNPSDKQKKKKKNVRTVKMYLTQRKS